LPYYEFMDKQVLRTEEIKQPNKYLSRKIIVAGVVVIVCVISALLYFNIPPLTPSAPVVQPTDKTIAVPTPTVFPYDTAKAEKLLADYLKDTLKPEFILNNIKVKQGLTLDNEIIESQPYEFSAYFNSRKATIASTFYYQKDTNIQNVYVVIIQTDALSQASPSANLANLTLPSYFSHPYPISNCTTDTLKHDYYCENFQTTDMGKIGYGIAYLYTAEGPNIQGSELYACFIPKESQYYNTYNSCVLK